eukprot:snap_masked-scaffold_21-processed-gene-1.23-mRNA-1 protein AED:1.00 eAED:1.00 QI:0/0/0/0/1/1/2/0/645
MQNDDQRINPFQPNRCIALENEAVFLNLIHEVSMIEADPLTNEIADELLRPAQLSDKNRRKRNFPQTTLQKNALHFACEANLQEIGIIEVLLSSGYSLKTKTGTGYSALNLAVISGDLQVVKLLLDSTFKSIKSLQKNYYYHTYFVTDSGYCPISIALLKSNVELAWFLIEYFSGLKKSYDSVDDFDELQIKIAKKITKNGKRRSLINDSDFAHSGEGILHLCITYDNYELFKYFLSVNIGKNSRKFEVMELISPILYASCANEYQVFNREETKDRYLYLVELVEDSFSVNSIYTWNGAELAIHISPLVCALQGSQNDFSERVLTFLLEKGATIFLGDQMWLQPINIAMRNNLPVGLELLFSHLEENDETCQLIDSPVSYTEIKFNVNSLFLLFTPEEEFSNSQILDVLLKYGGRIPEDDRSLLFQLAFRGSQSKHWLLYYEYLINHGANINLYTPGSPSLLTISVLIGYKGLPIVHQLLGKKVDLDLNTVMRACLSQKIHRVYRYSYNDIMELHNISSPDEFSFVCDYCLRDVEKGEYLMECDSNKKVGCNVSLCDDCAFIPGNSVGKRESSTLELALHISGPEKIFFCNLFLFVYSKFGTYLHSKGKLNQTGIYMDCGLTDGLFLEKGYTSENLMELLEEELA